MALTQGIDTTTVAAGDPIKAKLITPIRDGTRVLVPIGAAISARIVLIRQFYDAAPSVALEFKLETVDVGGVSVPLTAVQDTGKNFQKAKRGTLQQRVELGTLRSLDDRPAEFVFRNVHQPYLIRSGLESMWVTAVPAAGDSVPTPAK